jgi:hypothetical protein
MSLRWSAQYESTVTLQALIAADKRKVPLVNDSATRHARHSKEFRHRPPRAR